MNNVLRYLLNHIGFIKRYSLCIAILFVFGSNSLFANASRPIAIIGGQGNAPYAAFINTDGSVTTLPGLPTSGLTFRVAMNSFGEGLIGGTNGINAYAALVSPKGTLKPITGLIAPGEIYTVAINKSGLGLVGGGHLLSNTPYAALINSNGTATSLAVPTSGLIYGVAIDSSGEGIIGGVGPSDAAYAAITSKNGTVTPLTGLPSNGTIFWVSINHSHKKLIGGNNGSSIYAAFVSRNGTVTPLTGLPLGQNYSVAINASGEGIMGGTSLSLPFAALVAPNGSINKLKGLPDTSGIIYNVTINNSGTGLIAGFSASGPYGTFVAPDGTLTPLKGLPAGPGFLDGAAIHSSGVGIVGGKSFGSPFVALAAPNGALTFLNGLPNNGEINSIGIAALDSLVPESIGLFDSCANTQFAFSSALTQHCMIHHKNRFKINPYCNKCCSSREKDTCTSLWISVFGNYVRENHQHRIPSFCNEIIGTLLGFDYNASRNVVLGGGLGYAFNDVHYSRRLGNAEIHQESAVIYASLNKPYFYLNVALWGGLFQISNHRRSLSFISSRSNPSGCNLTPHLELSAPLSMTPCQRFIIEPFLSLDWTHNWQSHLREHGTSGFNIVLNNQYGSIFRSEIGIRLYETFEFCWGRMIFEEKGSYINITPIHKELRKASFVEASSSFDIATCNPSTQNRGIAQVHIESIPYNFGNTYTSLDYQGEFGASFQSHMLTFEMGKNF